MTDYRGLFKKAFAHVAPAQEEEAAARAVIEKGRAMKKTNSSPRKAAAAVIAAAAALAIGGVSFAAANGWSITEAFAQLFRQKAVTNELGGYRMEVDFAQYGRELDIVKEYDGITFHVRGIAADKYSVYLLYDLIFDEDIPTDGKWQTFVSFNVDGEFCASSGSHGVLSQEGNTLHCYEAWLFDGELVGSIEGKTLGVSLVEIEHYYDSENRVTYLNMANNTRRESVDIPIDFDIADSGISLEPNIPLTIYDRDCTLTKLELTPFSICYSIEGLAPEQRSNDSVMDVYFTYKNGEQCRNYGCIGSRHYGEERIVSALFAYPVAFEEIESVTIGDIVIPINEE